MSRNMVRNASWMACVLGLVGATFCAAAERKAAAKGDAEEVELFAAIAAEQIAAKVIPKDDTRVRLQLTNRTDRPLAVRVPAAIAAVPVLAQNAGFNFGGPGGGPGGFFNGGGGPGAGGGAGRNQALGVGGGGNPLGGAGFGPGAGAGFNGGGPGGFRGGLFDVPSGRATKIDLPAVCLEYAKRAPHHGIPYEIKPLAEWSSDPQVEAIVSALNDRTLDREVVQIAAWKATSGWSWEEMEAMTVVRPWGAVERRFAPDALTAARRLFGRLPPPNRTAATR